MSSFPRNRYSSASLLSAFEIAEKSVDEGNLVATLTIGDEEIDIEIENSAAGIEAARSALADITRLDDLVQDSNESECARSGLHERSFDLYIACITVQEDELVLGYYGAKVNTEWDAKFSLKNGKWEKENF